MNYKTQVECYIKTHLGKTKTTGRWPSSDLSHEVDKPFNEIAQLIEIYDARQYLEKLQLYSRKRR